MAYSFIAQAGYNNHPFNHTTLATDTSLTVLTSDTIIVAFYSIDTGPFSVTGQTGDTYLLAGSVSNSFYYYCVGASSGTYALTAAGGTHIQQVAAFQYRGLNAFQNFASAHVNPNATGANILNSGNAVCTAAPAMVWGCAIDQGQEGADPPTYNSITAGTSPLAFNDRGGFWPQLGSFPCARSEDVRVTSTGNYASTFGDTASSQADFFDVVALIFTEAPTGSLLVGQNTPTSGGTNNLSGGAGGMFWHVFTATTTGVATSLGIYINSVGGSNGLNLALYDVITGSLIASGSPTLAAGLCSIPINAIIIAGRPYALVYQGGANNGSIIVADDGTNNQVLFATNTAGSFPAKLPAGGGPTNLGVPSIFVNGTPNPTAASIPFSTTQFFTQDRLLVN